MAEHMDTFTEYNKRSQLILQPKITNYVRDLLLSRVNQLTIAIKMPKCRSMALQQLTRHLVFEAGARRCEYLRQFSPISLSTRGVRQIKPSD